MILKSSLTLTLIAALILIAGCAAGSPLALDPIATSFPWSGQSLPNQATTAPSATAASGVPAGSSITEVANRVRPAVVQVTNQAVVGTDQFNRPVPQINGIGSGVIYDPSGLILTNNHVIEGADQLVVGLPDGRSFSATVVGADPQTDLAVLRISAPDLPVARLGDSSTLSVGDWVVAIGNALGLSGGPTVTQGIVSALGRSIAPSNTPQPGERATSFLYDLIQTDAPINPGNSGGPLVNLQAQVVGINTLVATSSGQNAPAEGIGFAISINTARAIAGQLVAAGHVTHPYLGITYVALNPALAAHLKTSAQRGMYVDSVDPNSPASQAGIQQGDVIVSADGQPLVSESDLGRIINQHKPGDQVQLTIERDGRQQTIGVTLGQQPSS